MRGKDDKVRIILQDVPRVLDEHQTATIDAGEFFGEIAALSRMPRTATISLRGKTIPELLEIRARQGLRDLMRYDPTLRQHINRIYRERAPLRPISMKSRSCSTCRRRPRSAGDGRHAV